MSNIFLLICRLSLVLYFCRIFSSVLASVERSEVGLYEVPLCILLFGLWCLFACSMMLVSIVFIVCG